MKSKKTPEQRIYETEYKKIMLAHKHSLLSDSDKDNLLSLLDRVILKIKRENAKRSEKRKSA